MTLAIFSLIFQGCKTDTLVAWGTSGTDNSTDSDTDNSTDSGTDNSTDSGTDNSTDSNDTSGDTDTDCPFNLVGWAGVAGEGITSTIGGGNSSPVRPATIDELISYASDTSPRVIEISGLFDTGDMSIEVSADKTIIGLNSEATIFGGLDIRDVSNVIIQNLNIQGKGDGVAPADALSIHNSHHVWIDHCNIWDASDGNLDTTEGSDYITVSWTRFGYTDENHPHRMSCLVGASSNEGATDEGKLNTTWHHNWFGELVEQAMPRLLFGKSHVFNSYYNALDNSYCIGAGSFAGVLIENNYFKDVKDPHIFADTNITFITARNNIYDNTTGTQDTGGEADPFPDPPPYSYMLDAPEDVPDLVTRCSGPQ